jgi:POT family proton-dependent oligopeptide transporter
MSEKPAGHPPGLYTLFFTEMWERLSFYGMRALLVLFMADKVAEGGLGMTDETANAIYGLYTASAWLACLPGGWIADRLLGAQRAVWYGGLLITAGHFVLGIPAKPTFFLGLALVALGTGLLKPNVSTLVGQLYPEGGARRDAGFSIFYMGINLGAFIGPLVCSYLGEQINWHLGFTVAGFGMAAGLVQYRLTRHNLGDAGLVPPQPSRTVVRDWLLVAGMLLVLGLLAAGVYLTQVDPVMVAWRMVGLLAGIAAVYFAWAWFFAGLDRVERGRLVVIGVLFLAAMLFWAGFEQAGSSLNLFAERHTVRTVAIAQREFEVPAGWFQSINAIYIIMFAPMFAALWVGLARRNVAPSLTAKMAWGLLLLALGFVVMYFGARQATTAGKVWPHWLIATYLIHTFGELCLSPVGLSAVTKLAPPRLVGQMMGIWFLGTSLGNLVAGLLAGNVSGDNVAAMPGRFLQIVLMAGVAGMVLMLLAWPMRRLSGDVE